MEDLSLEAVEQAFSLWRTKRSSAKSPIPNYLWAMVSSLIHRYKKSVICKRLGLSGQQLKLLTENDADTATEGFVLATNSKALPQSDSSSSVINITIIGKQREAKFSFELNSLGQVLSHIEGLL